MKHVVANARLMAEEFVKRGYAVISGGTDNHSMLIDLRAKNVTGKDAENRLVEADITVNKNMVPFDTESPFVTSGIRVGTSAITSRGITTEEIPAIVEYIDEVLSDIENDDVVTSVRSKVNALMNDRPLFKW